MGVPSLAKIEPIVSRLIAPQGSKVVGQTPDGRIIYERTVDRGRNEPDIDPETGKQRWELHPTTAQPLYRRFRLRSNPQTYQFTLHDPGNGNVREEPYRAPTPEEIKVDEDRVAAQRFQADLAEAAVKEGVTVADLLSAIKGGDEKPKRGRKADA